MATDQSVSLGGRGAAKNNTDSMKIGKGLGFGNTLGTATLVQKQEEMPYGGKAIGEGSTMDANGMIIEGDSGIKGTGPNRGNVPNVYNQ